MKKICPYFLPLLYFIFHFPAKLQAQSLDSSNLPILILDTYGQTIQDDPRITVFLGIIDNGPGNMNHVTDPFTNYNGEVTIEIRGSTSQQYPKRAYAFTPVDSIGNTVNSDILNLPPENDWILYAPYPDKTLMRNTFAYSIANKMGHYASRTRFVELIRNGDYRGVYEIQEKIKQDANRVDISKLTLADTTGDQLTGGYIIKIDKTTGSGSSSFISSYDPDVFFQYHDPEDVDLLPVQQNYIASYVDSFETSLLALWFANPDSGFRKFADENSFIDFFILQELGHTVDGYRSSCFLHKDKDSKGGKLTMGPLWDFNLSFGNADYCSAYDTIGWQYQFNSVCTNYSPHVPFWWNRMLQDTKYKNSLRCRWEELRHTFLNTDSVNSWIDSVALLLDNAQQRNFIKWPILGVYVNWNYYVGQNYSDEVSYLKMWLEARLRWLDANMPGTCSGVGISEKDVTQKLHISPNPTTGKFVFELDDLVSSGTLEITNSIGIPVFSLNTFSQNKFEINLGNKPPGIYFLKLFDGRKFQFAKIELLRN